jgi:hypothetical protein
VCLTVGGDDDGGGQKNDEDHDGSVTGVDKRRAHVAWADESEGEG